MDKKHSWNPYYKAQKVKREKRSDRALAEGLIKGDRLALSRSITRIEGASVEQMIAKDGLLAGALERPKKTWRIAITGAPGVGKSSFIEDIGTYLADRGRRIAVLAIDPSSKKSGGSILGDKTRMARLARHPNAFVRPSAAGKSLGGVHASTRESMLLCEAAGFELIFVETVGVGQSETAISDMVDMMVLLLDPGAGDELQGIKRGIVELADLLCITKAEINPDLSRKTVQAYQNGLHILQPKDHGTEVRVVLHDSLSAKHAQTTWQHIEHFFEASTKSGFFEKNRRKQDVLWFENLVHRYMLEQLLKDRTTAKELSALRLGVESGKVSVLDALEQVIGRTKNS